jgi:hypothetical protein
VVIHHVGYQNAALRHRKLERDLRLLQREDGEHPDHAFTLFNLSSVYLNLGRPAVLRARAHLARREFAAAREVLQRTIARAPEAPWPRVILSHVELQEGRDWGAAERALLDILQRDPEHKEARHNLAILRGRVNGVARAAQGTG